LDMALNEELLALVHEAEFKFGSVKDLDGNSELLVSMRKASQLMDDVDHKRADNETLKAMQIMLNAGISKKTIYDDFDMEKSEFNQQIRMGRLDDSQWKKVRESQKVRN